MSVNLKRVGSFEGSSEFPQEKKQKIDNDSSLFPNEVVLKIFSYCDPFTLENTLVTNKKWSQLTIECVRESGRETMKKAILECIKTIKSSDLLNESNPLQFKRLETFIIELPKEITKKDTIKTTLNKMKTISSSVVSILCEIPSLKTPLPNAKEYFSSFKKGERISLSEEKKEKNIDVIIYQIFNSSLFFNSINIKIGQYHIEQLIQRKQEDLLNQIQELENFERAEIEAANANNDDADEIDDAEEINNAEETDEADTESLDNATMENMLDKITNATDINQSLALTEKLRIKMQKSLQAKQ